MGRIIFRNSNDSDLYVPRSIATPIGSIGLSGRAPSLTITPTGGGGGSSGNLFNNSWENGGLGCGLTPLLDNGAWEDYGGPGICSEGPSGGAGAEITNAFAAPGFGSRSLRVWQMPGNINGTDFRIIKSFALQNGTVYMRWYIRWGNNWHFGNGDHKMCIVGPNTSTQYVYWNVRDFFGDSSRGRLTAYNNQQDTVWCDNRPEAAFVKNTWYCISVRMVTGTNGSLAAKVNTVDAVFSHDAGTPRDINNHTVSPGGINYIKMDSTYNNGASITEPMDQYWDGIAVGNTGWIGL